MSSLIIRFPDGSREFRYPQKQIEQRDVLVHAGARYRVISVSSNGDGRDIATVELVAEGVIDILKSEEGASAIHLELLDSLAATGG